MATLSSDSLGLKGHVSPNQIGQGRCGYMLMYYRLRRAHERGEHLQRSARNCPLCAGWEPPPTSISSIFGSAVHEGIEFYLANELMVAPEERMEAALDVTRRFLGYQVEAEPVAVRWDEEPRKTKRGFVYRGDEGRVPNLETGQRNAERLVRAWIERFGQLEAADIEVPVDMDLHAYGFPDWRLSIRLDCPTAEGGLIDFKTANREWKEDSWDSKLDQAFLYFAAFEAEYGVLPEYFAFHVGLKGTERWQVIEVDVERTRIEQVVEHSVEPLIRVIETEAYTPNRSGWWHSEKFCDYWAHCPLGAAAQKGAREVG